MPLLRTDSDTTTRRYMVLDANPFGTMAAITAVFLGSLGIVLGDGVSQGMTLTLHSSANITAHIWGAMLMIGGVLKLIGLYGFRTTVEIPGLWMMIGGYAFYSITVVAGLGMHGLAAGTVSGGLTVGCFLKTRLIMKRARLASQLTANRKRR